MYRTIASFRRIIPALALLLGLVFVLDACTTRRRRADDDDDTTANDDDTSNDDDDSGSTGDDDDDDDSGSTGDDDDEVSPGILTVTADQSNLGPTPVGVPITTTVYFENTGGSTLTVNVTLTDFAAWSLPNPQIYVAPDAVETRTLTFNPPAAGTFQMQLEASHDGFNASPQVIPFQGTTSGGPTTETSCNDGVDNDADGDTDCDDPDCNGDPACTGGGDLCCNPMPGTQGPGPCSNQTVANCVCSSVNYCCFGGHGDWDATCVDYYTGDAGHCGGSSTCP